MNNDNDLNLHLNDQIRAGFATACFFASENTNI